MIIHALSKEFNVSWDVILNWNVVKFNHMVEFMHHYAKEMKKNVK